jgi:hypothetical protein
MWPRFSLCRLSLLKFGYISINMGGVGTDPAAPYVETEEEKELAEFVSVVLCEGTSEKK